MTQLSSLLNLVLGFVVVMAAVSMLVSLVVNVLHRMANTRSRQLAEMLARTIYAFRQHHGDYGSANDAASAAFVRDVLDDAAMRMAAPSSAGELTGQDRGARGAIHQDELRAVVERRSPQGELPRSWYVSLDPAQATSATFVAWLAKWFPSIEANATERFRNDSAHLVAVVSFLAVVLLNLDAFQLASDLFSQASLASTLAEHATGLSKLADSGLLEGEPSKDELGDFVQLNAVLNVTDLKLGWQRSAFIERYCAMRQTCASPTSLTGTTPREDWPSFLQYVARWLLGLVVSALLLSLGAPFWADLLRDLLRPDRRPASGDQAASSG